MILKLGMKHQAMELYKICINCDPRMTLTYFMSQSTLVTHAFEWINFVNCYLKRKTCSKLANGLKFYDLKKKFTPGVALTWPGVIYMYITILFKHVYWYIYLGFQVSVYHWSSGLSFFYFFFYFIFFVLRL